MDPSVYEAAMLGQVDILDEIKRPLTEELDPNGNTILHIAARYGRNEWIQEEVLGRLDSTSASLLLLAVNAKGETALHVAAREGHSIVIEDLVQLAEELDDDSVPAGNRYQDILTSRNEAGDTALHMAVRSSIVNYQRWVDAITMLIFPGFAYLANESGETPLYLAAECDSFELVKLIAENAAVTSPDVDNYSGPRGRTALHAAVISNHQENTSFLLDWKKDLGSRADLRGWTPLHCAAEFDRAQRVIQLLELDISFAYQTTTMEEDTALHIAAQHGSVSVIKELVSRCPGCWEMVNARAQNVLHVAIAYQQKELIKFFENNPPYLGSLINQKDVDGNTPIHLAARYGRLLDLSKHDLARPLRISFNKENQTPLHLLAHSDYLMDYEKREKVRRLIKAGLSPARRNTGSEPALKEESGEDCLPKSRDTCLIAAALVATVTFTAGITVPGGYNGNLGPNQGTAMLLKHGAFICFVVADTVAFMLSTLALLTYLLSSSDTYRHKIMSVDQRSSQFTYFSVVAMAFAFATGTYSVLSHLPALAVTVSAGVGISFAGFVRFYFIAIGLKWNWKSMKFYIPRASS